VSAKDKDDDVVGRICLSACTDRREIADNDGRSEEKNTHERPEREGEKSEVDGAEIKRGKILHAKPTCSSLSLFGLQRRNMNQALPRI